MFITKRDEILNFIALHVAEYGYEPSYSAIAKRFGIERSTVHAHMQRLIVEDKVKPVPRTRQKGQYVMKYRPEVTM